MLPLIIELEISFYFASVTLFKNCFLNKIVKESFKVDFNIEVNNEDINCDENLINMFYYCEDVDSYSDF